MLVTVEALREKLKDLPDDAVMDAYEGEGGSWIMIRDRDTNKVLEEVNVDVSNFTR